MISLNSNVKLISYHKLCLCHTIGAENSKLIKVCMQNRKSGYHSSFLQLAKRKIDFKFWFHVYWAPEFTHALIIQNIYSNHKKTYYLQLIFLKLSFV